MKYLGAILFLLISFGVHSQGEIRGFVKDSVTNDSLALVRLIVLGQDEKFIAYTNSNFDGTYSIKNISAGTYNLKVTYLGYMEKVIPNIVVTDSQATVININLLEYIPADSVVVNYSPNKLNKDAIKPLPKRRPQDALKHGPTFITNETDIIILDGITIKYEWKEPDYPGKGCIYGHPLFYKDPIPVIKVSRAKKYWWSIKSIFRRKQ